METIMFSTKKILAAASLVVIAAAGLGSASAAPWDRHENRAEHRIERHDNRMDHRDARFERRIDHRAYVNRLRVSDTLRFHHYRVIGEPYFVHDRYVVRTHDRFGRLVFVQVDPYSGAFVREVRL
jgi:hypothetical protein